MNLNAHAQLEILIKIDMRVESKNESARLRRNHI